MAEQYGVTANGFVRILPSAGEIYAAEELVHVSILELQNFLEQHRNELQWFNNLELATHMRDIERAEEKLREYIRNLGPKGVEKEYVSITERLNNTIQANRLATDVETRKLTSRIFQRLARLQSYYAEILREEETNGPQREPEGNEGSH